MRTRAVLGLMALAATLSGPAHAVDGIGAANWYNGSSSVLRIFKVKDTRVDTSYDMTAANTFFGGLAINTHGTHIAYWRRTRQGTDSTYQSTDWRNVLASADDAALFLLGKSSVTVANIATITGLTQTRVNQLKARVDSIEAIGGSRELWVVDQCRRSLPNAWNFDLSYDATAQRWSKVVARVIPEYRLTLARIDNPSKSIDLLITGKDLVYWRAPGTVAWPRGDWVYFTTSGEGYRFIYRVSTQTREVQFITLIDQQWRMVYPGEPCCVIGDEFKMSAIGDRMLLSTTGLVFTLQDLQAAGGILSWGAWGSGGWNALGGCGHSLSPSGNYGGNQYDPGHMWYCVNRLDWDRDSTWQVASMTHVMRNQWAPAADKADPQLACTIARPEAPESSFVETIGVGNATYGHNFAVNSDEWVCLCSGWSPGGRDGFNNMNFVLCNYRDSLSLNVSRGLRRKNAPYGRDVEAQCYTQANTYFASEAFFFVSAPSGDILPELLADATSGYAVPGVDDNTQLSALSMMALTPYTGLPFTAVSRAPGVRGLTRYSDVSVRRSSVTGSDLVVDLSPAAGACEVTVLDARGAVVARRATSDQRLVFSVHDGIRAGVYIVRIRANGGMGERSVRSLTSW